jgi:signal peptidase I
MTEFADGDGQPGSTAGPAAAGTNAGGRASRSGRPARRRRRRAAVEWILALVVAVVLATVVRTFLFQVFWVPTSSMEPTLNPYDRILVQKAFFSASDVREGDILVFTPPARDTMCSGPRDTDLVKRVIGLPGQTIYSVGNKIFINGHVLAEPYLPRHDPLGLAIPGGPKSPFRIPRGEFYMMGDNRAVSCDSRYWGPIKASEIVGRVVMLLWANGHPDLRFF